MTHCYITPESILQSMENARALMPSDNPDLILITYGAMEKVRKEIPVGSRELDIATIYGIPYESYPTLRQVHERALDIQETGKRICVVCE